MEEATYRGISINATVSFTLPQAIAVAEAVERGLKRREAEGLDITTMGPVCTIMVGRLDDWLKVVMEKEKLSIDPGYLEWAGVAVFKKAYKLYKERGYRLRLLSAAFRNHMHWSEFIGGDGSSPRLATGKSASMQAMSKPLRGWTSRSIPRSSRRFLRSSLTSRRLIPKAVSLTKSSRGSAPRGELLEASSEPARK